MKKCSQKGMQVQKWVGLIQYALTHCKTSTVWRKGCLLISNAEHQPQSL